MTAEDTHQLLQAQIKKANLTKEQIELMAPFLKSVGDTYKTYDNDHKHLVNALEDNSLELKAVNKQLRCENVLRTEEATQARTSLNKIVNNVTNIIIEMDKKGNFTYLNSAWKKFSNECPNKSIGKNYMEFSGSIQFFDLALNKKIKTRNFDNFKTVFSKTDSEGVLKWWEMSTKMIRDENDQFDGAIASIIEVTSLKETEAELIKANQSKTRFLSTMSHEIRTPLNAVIAISNILLMEDPKPEQLKNLKTLKHSSKHLLHIINDILDYNKLVSGSLKFDNSSFDVVKEVTSTIHTMSFNANEKRLKLNLSIDENVPQFICGDSHRLSQVLTNLVNNAIKFTATGSIDVIVGLVDQSDSHSKINFKVCDTGIGISEDKLELIFDRFTQAESDTTKKYGGTGLGLAICKRIIELQDSKIKVESKLDEGTCFSFDLDFGLVANQTVEEDHHDMDYTEFSLEGTKLLIVDDNEINLMVLKQFLDNWNIQYDDARDGVEALEKIKDHNYDLVLLDLQMPKKNGFTVAKELREMSGAYFQNLPIIALSASVSTDITDRVINSGMNDYLCKPFEPQALFQKLKWYCARKAVVVVG